MNIDQRFMMRAIQLARHGLGNTSPNPMVGAVIVHDGKIIGEGYHRRCGEGHAEVNAVASVADKSLLKDSTIYVTLEPCSHFGKTPPCSRLILDCGIPRVVVGSLDPNEKVSGRGIKMLREGGVEVVTGVLEHECRAINPVFMTAHTLRRPWVTLKWAQSADGYIDTRRSPDEPSAKFSTPVTKALTHRLRSLHDAIMAGSGTVKADNPALDVRDWAGRNPRRIIAGHRDSIPSGSRILNEGDEPLILEGTPGKEAIEGYLTAMFAEGITSVLVEGGASLLQSFIDSGIWDMARVEVAPVRLAGGVKAPSLARIPDRHLTIGNNNIYYYSNNQLLWS